MTACVTFPVITVFATTVRAVNRPCAFCTPIAAAPSSPQTIVAGASALPIGDAATPASMNPASRIVCSAYSERARTPCPRTRIR